MRCVCCYCPICWSNRTWLKSLRRWLRRYGWMNSYPSLPPVDYGGLVVMPEGWKMIQLARDEDSKASFGVDSEPRTTREEMVELVGVCRGVEADDCEFVCIWPSGVSQTEEAWRIVWTEYERRKASEPPPWELSQDDVRELLKRHLPM